MKENTDPIIIGKSHLITLNTKGRTPWEVRPLA